MTADCGNTIHRFDTGRVINKVKFSPLKYDWVLASSTSLCTKKQIKTNTCIKKEELFVTKNLKDWKYVSDFVEKFDWLGTYQNLAYGVQSESFIYTRELKDSKLSFT